MLSPKLASDLSLAAGQVVANVLANGGARSSKPRGEVGAVRSMTLDGFDGISAAWSPIVRTLGYRIELHAVFCHSSPQVTFRRVPHPRYRNGKNPRQCELADLLIVIDHVDRLKNFDDRRAVLVQAKVLKDDAVKPAGQEWVQHELLAWLAPFRFVDRAYDPRVRDLGRHLGDGWPAEYGGLDLCSSPPKWRHELPKKIAPWFNSPELLATHLAYMATGERLYGCRAVRGGADDWSFTVDELLRVTAARPMTRRSHVTRGNQNVIGFMAEASPQICNPSAVVSGGGGGVGDGDGRNEFFDETNSTWPEGPISTVHITLGPMEESLVY